jgi:hypothetical protein
VMPMGKFPQSGFGVSAHEPSLPALVDPQSTVFGCLLVGMMARQISNATAEVRNEEPPEGNTFASAASQLGKFLHSTVLCRRVKGNERIPRRDAPAVNFRVRPDQGMANTVFSHKMLIIRI